MTDGPPTDLPGEELVRKGLADLSAGWVSDESLLVLIAAPRLVALGLTVPEVTPPSPPEHLLYSRIEERLGTGAHSYYNSLIRRVVSYARALEGEKMHASGIPAPPVANVG